MGSDSLSRAAEKFEMIEFRRVFSCALIRASLEKLYFHEFYFFLKVAEKFLVNRFSNPWSRL